MPEKRVQSVPKKAQHGRPQRSKPRARQTTSVRPEGAVLEGNAALQGLTTSSVQPRPQPSRAAASPVRRPQSTSRKTPLLSVNYAYLRQDITWLAGLAPAMIVILIIAYVVFH